jgi:hypothetical protein
MNQSPTEKRQRSRRNNRPVSASRDRKSSRGHMDDYVINQEFYDEIPGINGNSHNDNHRDNRPRERDDKHSRMHRARSQGATNRNKHPENDADYNSRPKTGVNRQRSFHNHNQGSNHQDNNEPDHHDSLYNKLQNFRQRGHHDDTTYDKTVNMKGSKTPQPLRRAYSQREKSRPRENRDKSRAREHPEKSRPRENREKSRPRDNRDKSRTRDNRVKSNLPADYWDDQNNNGRRIFNTEKVANLQSPKQGKKVDDRFNDFHDHRNHNDKRKSKPKKEYSQNDREVVFTNDRNSPSNQGIRRFKIIQNIYIGLVFIKIYSFDL